MYGRSSMLYQWLLFYATVLLRTTAYHSNFSCLLYPGGSRCKLCSTTVDGPVPVVVPGFGLELMKLDPALLNPANIYLSCLLYVSVPVH